MRNDSEARPRPGQPAFPVGWVTLAPWPDTTSDGSSWSQYTNQPVAVAGTAVRVTGVCGGAYGWNLAAVEVTGDDG